MGLLSENLKLCWRRPRKLVRLWRCVNIFHCGGLIRVPREVYLIDFSLIDAIPTENGRMSGREGIACRQYLDTIAQVFR
jgi:hypothetical protein